MMTVSTQTDLSDAASTAGQFVSGLRDFSPQPKKSSALRVLVVDNEPPIRWSLAETLMDCGHQVYEAVNGPAAFAAIREASAPPVDVVLLDYGLLDSNDIALLAAVRDEWPATQIVLMTSDPTPAVAADALQLGAYCIVSKPLEMNSIPDLVRRAHDSRPG